MSPSTLPTLLQRFFTDRLSRLYDAISVGGLLAVCRCVPLGGNIMPDDKDVMIETANIIVGGLLRRSLA